MRANTVAALGAIIGVAAGGGGVAEAALDVSRFSVTPSTTRAGAHPNLNVSFSFSDPAAGVKDVKLHLPTGLSANSRAIPFCSRKRLLADLCPARTKAGVLTVVGEAFGFRLEVSRRIYNVRPIGAEPLRLAVPIVGSFSRPGFAAELPLTARPSDKGLDMAVTGLPREVGGIKIQIDEVRFSLRGIARIKIRKRVRNRVFLTNPLSCTPATSVLEVTSQDTQAATIIRTSAFTPTGCAGSP